MPLRSSIPVVVTFHDMTFFLHSQYHTLAKRLFFPWMIKQSARRASALLAVSESTRQDAIRLLKLDPAAIQTTLLGYDRIFASSTDPARKAQVLAKYHLSDQMIHPIPTPQI